MADRVITGALIKISVTPRGGQTTVIGRAMSMDIQEQYSIAPVFAIGNLTAQELPVLRYSGGFNISQFGFSKTALENLMAQFKRQGAPGVEDKAKFIRQLLYTDGIDVTITRREKQGNNEVEVPLAKISGAVCQAESMTISENQIMGRSGSFIFADPIKV